MIQTVATGYVFLILIGMAILALPLLWRFLAFAVPIGFVLLLLVLAALGI